MKLVRRELGAWLRVAPWMLVSLLLVAVLWRSDTTALAGLFQSPQSPVPTATALPSTATPTQAPTQEPTETPTEVPTAVPTVTEAIPGTGTLTITETAAPVVTATAALTATAVPGITPLSSPSPALEATAESGRYPGEDPALKFDWGMLFDSVALGVSYVWLCCGILLLVSIPVVFVILWVVSKRRKEQQE